MMAGKGTKFLILFMLLSCSRGHNISRYEAISLAREYVKGHPVYSRSAIDIENVVISENREEFVLKFSPMDGYIGGSPTVYVRKRDGRITKVIATQ